MLKRKFELDEKVYFYTNISKTVSNGTIVGLWTVGEEGKEIFNYQIEYVVVEEVQEGKKKVKKKIRQMDIIQEENITRDKDEMIKKFIPYVQKAIKNKIKLVQGEIKDMNNRIKHINEEMVQATNFIADLEEKLGKMSPETVEFDE